MRKTKNTVSESKGMNQGELGEVEATEEKKKRREGRGVEGRELESG